MSWCLGFVLLWELKYAIWLLMTFIDEISIYKPVLAALSEWSPSTISKISTSSWHSRNILLCRRKALNLELSLASILKLCYFALTSQFSSCNITSLFARKPLQPASPPARCKDEVEVSNVWTSDVETSNAIGRRRPSHLVLSLLFGRQLKRRQVRHVNWWQHKCVQSAKPFLCGKGRLESACFVCLISSFTPTIWP